MKQWWEDSYPEGYHCNIEQYRMVKRCSEKRDMSEWKQWRADNLYEGLWLQGAYFLSTHCEGADFTWAHCEGANFMLAHCEGAYFTKAHCEGALFRRAYCEGAYFLMLTARVQTFWMLTVKEQIFPTQSFPQAPLSSVAELTARPCLQTLA